MENKQKESSKIDVEKTPLLDILRTLKIKHYSYILISYSIIFTLGYNVSSIININNNQKNISQSKSSSILISKQTEKQKNYLLRKKISLSEISGYEYDEARGREEIDVLLNPKLRTESYIWKNKCEKIVNYKESYFIVKKSYKEKYAVNAIKICKKAKELNPTNLKYDYLLAIAYHKNQDYEQTVLSIKKLASVGYKTAQRKIGIMYSLGDLVEKDLQEGKQWLLKAAENGDNSAKELIDSKLFLKSIKL